MNSTQTAPATGQTSGTVSFPLSWTPGNYEFRFFANGTWQRVAVSGIVTAVSYTQLALNGVPPPTAIAAVAGSTVSISITNGPGFATDWIGLYAAGISDYYPLNWRYMNSTQNAPATGQTGGTVSFPLPSTYGDYEFRFFANLTWQRVAVSGIVTTVPPPTVTSVTPSSAHVGDVVTIGGANLRNTQGASTVTFNGTTATPVYWSSGSIALLVPPGATTGPVVVTVLAVSNSSSFTVTAIAPGTISGTITRATGGSAISGATIEARQAGILKSSVTTAANGTYSIANLDPATYDVRVLASGFSNEVRSTVISPNATSTVNVALSQPGSISGTITEADGTTPIAGAAVALYFGPVAKGATSTNGTGAYSLANLPPGAYTVQAASVGSRTKQQGATIADSANTTANLSLDPAASGPVSYVYDELDRLVSVIDPSGDAAHYTYDAVGNLLSIARAGVGTVSISEVAPHAAPIGSPIAIYGTGFSATPSSNTVTFNGTLATVTTSSATALATTVPPGATTGSITVTTPMGSATSGSAFLVFAASVGAPTITSFSPQIWDGASALTITGTNFDATPANDRVNLNVGFATPTTASPTNLTVAVPSTATSGRLTVVTMTGSASSATDFFIPPAGFLAGNIDSTGRMTFGTSQTVSISTAGKFAMRLFDGVRGQRISLAQSGFNCFTSTTTILNPTGSPIASACGGDFIDVRTLATTGTYTILVDPKDATTGSTTLTLYDVPADVTGSIVPGGVAVTVTTTVPGQNARLTFSATAGQRISLGQSGYNCFTSATTILNPDGSTVASTCGGSFIEMQTLSTTGTYTILVDPKDTMTGSTTLTLYDVPADVTGSIVPGGAAVTVTTTVPGQNARLTFSATAGQRISLGQSGYNCFTSTTTILNPDGSTVASTCEGFIDVRTLATTGTYTILVDPKDVSTGSTTLTLYSVLADTTGTVTIGGSAVAAALSTPGQNGTLTFSGSASQQVTVHVTGNTIGWVAVTLLGTDGVTVLAQVSSPFDAFDLATTTLGAAGTYTIRIDPSGGNTGALNVSVTNP